VSSNIGGGILIDPLAYFIKKEGEVVSGNKDVHEPDTEDQNKEERGELPV
jgi:hypothetical protein